MWPDLAVAKLSRLHARAPFDLVVGAFVRAKIDELAPRLSRRASQQAVATLNQIREQMALRIDPFGYGPNEVPMTGLSAQLKAFQKSLDEIFGTDKKAGTLDFWDDVKLSTLATGEASDPGRQVTQLDRVLKAQSADRAAVAQRIGANAAKLLKMVQDGQAKIAEAATLDETLLARYNAEKEQAATFGRIVDDLLVNDTTIGIGRPAAAPYSLVWNPDAAKPFAFYGDKDGAPPPGAPNDLHEIAGRYQNYALLIADFDAAWKAVEPHVAPAIGHLTGKQKNDPELAALKTGMATVYEKAAALRAGLQNGPAEFTLAPQRLRPVRRRSAEEVDRPAAGRRSDDGDRGHAAGADPGRYPPVACARCRSRMAERGARRPAGAEGAAQGRSGAAPSGARQPDGRAPAGRRGAVRLAAAHRLLLRDRPADQPGGRGALSRRRCAARQGRRPAPSGTLRSGADDAGAGGRPRRAQAVL